MKTAQLERAESLADSLRAAIAGGQAARVLAASAALFEAGGKHLLSDATKSAVRTVAEKGAEKAIAMAAGPLFEPVKALGAKPVALLRTSGGAIAKQSTRAVGKAAARVAAKEVAKGAGRAAGIGFVIDGAVASIEAVSAVRNGSADRATAVRYVAVEATTGAIATGAGVLLGAGLVAVTGGLAAPVVFAVGALGSIGTKRLLKRLVNRDEAHELGAATPSR
ncbi:MAG: hypothetical protein JST00_25420 [Deltaproteobacteria bacterium]|nr:hypothetical protein [Deltaproteobacteria bacterium]